MNRAVFLIGCAAVAAVVYILFSSWLIVAGAVGGLMLLALRMDWLSNPYEASVGDLLHGTSARHNRDA